MTIKLIETGVSYPEEVQSFRNIQETFPENYNTGRDLLARLAGLVAQMRMDTELFCSLLVPDNKECIKSHAQKYELIAEEVSTFRKTLTSLNAQIGRAIELIQNVQSSDVRTFSDATKQAIKVFEFCQKILPTIKDWQVQGICLDKRFNLVMTYDKKNYNNSIAEFTSATNVQPWSASGVVSSITGAFSGYFFASSSAAASSTSPEASAPTTDEEKKSSH